MQHSDYEIRCAILNTVVYADIFDYPLTLPEIHQYLTRLSASLETVSRLVDSGGFLQKNGPYYTLPGRELIVKTRERREQMASQLWPEAIRYGRMIAGLPFVRMVAVTGSLAMNNVEANADIDYLIVTIPGRLWISRLLSLLVTHFAARRGISLCPNFLLTQNVLELPDHSLYTAHEFVQMIPISGLDLFQRMRAVNPWVSGFLPNGYKFNPTSGNYPIEDSAFLLRPQFEWVLLTPVGNWLERWEMNRKIRKLSRENIGNPEAVFNADLCKGHSNRHGLRTEMLLKNRIANMLLETVREEVGASLR